MYKKNTADFPEKKATRAFPALTFHYQFYFFFLFNKYAEIQCARA